MSQFAYLPVGVAAFAVGATALYLGRKYYFSGGKCYIKDRLDGKIAIVTGANSGIGLETCGELARRGATVIMAGRSKSRLEEAKIELLKRYKAGEKALTRNLANLSVKPSITHINEGQLILEILDLSSLKSVREFSHRMLIRYPQIHLLVNNAGVMNCPFALTTDGFEMTIGTNHIGHFYLTTMLLPCLRAASPDSRVINVSSMAHKFCSDLHLPELCYHRDSYSHFKAYCDSKMANIVFTVELARRLKGSGVTTVSLHPGVIRTNIQRYWNPILLFLFNLASPFSKSTWEGCQTTLYCCLANDLVSGGYYSDCKLTQLSSYATDPEIGRQLWTCTEQMIAKASGGVPSNVAIDPSSSATPGAPTAPEQSSASGTPAAMTSIAEPTSTTDTNPQVIQPKPQTQPSVTPGQTPQSSPPALNPDPNPRTQVSPMSLVSDYINTPTESDLQSRH